MSNIDLNTLEGFREGLDLLLSAGLSSTTPISEAAAEIVKRTDSLADVPVNHRVINNYFSKTQPNTGIEFFKGDTNQGRVHFLLVSSNGTNNSLEISKYENNQYVPFARLNNSGKLDLLPQSSGMTIAGRDILREASATQNGLMPSSAYSKLANVENNATKTLVKNYSGTEITSGRVAADYNTFKTAVDAKVTNYYVSNKNNGYLGVRAILGQNGDKNIELHGYNDFTAGLYGMCISGSGNDNILLCLLDKIITDKPLECAKPASFQDVVNFNNIVKEKNIPTNLHIVRNSFILMNSEDVHPRGAGDATITHVGDNIVRIDFHFAIFEDLDAEGSINYGINADLIDGPLGYTLNPLPGGYMWPVKSDISAAALGRGMSFEVLSGKRFWVPVKAMLNDSDTTGVNSNNPSAFVEHLHGVYQQNIFKSGDVYYGVCYATATPKLITT